MIRMISRVLNQIIVLLPSLERDREDLTIFRSLFRLHISRFQISPEADHILAADKFECQLITTLVINII